MKKSQLVLLIATLFFLAALWLWYLTVQKQTSLREQISQLISPTTPPPQLPVFPVADIPIFTPVEDNSLAANSFSLPAISTTSAQPAPSDLTPTHPLVTQLSSRLTAPAALAIDLDSQAILFAKNPHAHHFPASTLKMMTALVARQLYPPDQIITLTLEDITSSNSLRLQPGEKLTVADLLQALLISSSNEAAQALSNHSPQGPLDFINKMNLLATQLNLADTAFVTPEGFDSPDQQTSAHDLALLAQAMLSDPYLKTVVALPHTTISTANGLIHELTSTNRFLSQPPIITISRPATSSASLPLEIKITPTFYGVKTGTTPQAGEVLISAASVSDPVHPETPRHLLFVVMGSADRYQDTRYMLEWVLNNYTWQSYGDP